MEISRDTVVEILSQIPFCSQMARFEVARLADAFVPIIYQDGDLIFDNEDDSEAFFVLYAGMVALFSDQDDEIELLANLSSGDFFGEEALLFDDPRYYRAVASGTSVILVLASEHFHELYENNPHIEAMLDASIQSRKLSTQVYLPWMQDDEHVFVMAHRHAVILWSKMLAPSLLGLGTLILTGLLLWLWLPGQPYGWIVFGVSLPVSLIWLMWVYGDWRNDFMIVTNKRVVWVEKVPFISESRQEAPLRTIMAVGVDRTRLGRLLGFGDVVVTTSVGTIRLRQIAHSEVIALMTEAYWHSAERKKRRDEVEMMERKLVPKLNLPNRLDTDIAEDMLKRRHSAEEDEESEPGFLSWLFSGLFRLRHEQDGMVTHRKHWFVLIKQLWLPVVFMLLAVTAAVLWLGGWFTFLPVTTALIVLMLVMFLITLWMFFIYADWQNDIFMVTLDQIIVLDRTLLGKTSRRTVLLEDVLSIEYERSGFWGYLLNFGTVFITVGNEHLVFDHIYNPAEVQEDIFFRMGERVDTVRQNEIDTERERVSEFIPSYQRRANSSQAEGQQHTSDTNCSQEV